MKKDIKIPIEVYMSTNYSQFKIGNNRRIKREHIKKLVKSMQKSGFIPLFRILVTKNGYVIDGQHRLEAAKIAGVAFYYEVCDMSTAMIAKLNQMKVNWNSRDYMYFYASENKANYIKLQKFAESATALSMTAVLAIVNFGLTKKNGVKEFEDGKFIFKNQKRAVEILKYLKDFAPFVSAYNTRAFVRAFIAFLAEENPYNHVKMINKLKVQGSRFTRDSETAFYTRMLKETYHSK